MELTSNISKQTKYLLYFILATVIYFVFFHRLSSFYMRTWDESIYAVNSYEMMHNGNYLVPHINGQIDIINDKPPLFFWHQILSFKLFGYNEFAARFPSALYGALSVLLLFAFIGRHFGLWQGFTASIILCASMGFVTFHSSRTGDMDTMLAFGVLAMFLSLYAYREYNNINYYLFFGIALVFAFLTKTMAALLVLPGFFIFLFFKNLRLLFKWKVWIINILVLVCISIFLFVRNQYADHYFYTHFLGYFGRYDTSYNKDHVQSWDFYLNNIYNVRYSIFALLLIPAGIVAWKQRNEKQAFFALSSLLSALFIFVILSIASSKCYWYDVPLYPLFAISVGFILYKIARNANFIQIPVGIALMTFLAMPVYYAIKRSHNNDISDVEARKCEVIPEYFYSHKNMSYDRIVVCDNNYNSPVLFYKYMFKNKNKEIIIGQASELQLNDIVIAGNDSIKNYITQNFRTEQLENFKHATIYKIKT